MRSKGSDSIFKLESLYHVHNSFKHFFSPLKENWVVHKCIR